MLADLMMSYSFCLDLCALKRWINYQIVSPDRGLALLQ